MFSGYLKIIPLILFTLLLCAPNAIAQNNSHEQHTLVAMRMIGHQVLLQSKDSLSRVMPVEKVGNRYKIQFENEFEFNPGLLANTIDSILQIASISNAYVVEVEECETGILSYSYEINSEKVDLLPCGTRMQPKACYLIFISLLDVDQSMIASQGVGNNPVNGVGSTTADFTYSKLIISLSIILIVLGLFGFLRRKSRKYKMEPHWISIGEFKLNKRTSELFYEHQRIELTSKEADLLLLLNDTANTTLERDFILKVVWGDEGHYVGRTLDVFISKLRKKLEADPGLKIVNIRGVGYKLVLDV